jgi:hypothetical protein
MSLTNVGISDEVRYIILNEGENKSNELYRLKKDWTLQIKLSPELSWRKVRIFTNGCINNSDQFDRLIYNELKWIYPSDGKNDDTDRYVIFLCSKPGAFHYYFTIDGTT